MKEGKGYDDDGGTQWFGWWRQLDTVGRNSVYLVYLVNSGTNIN